MRFASTLVAFATALSYASAHPSSAAHRHAQLHRRIAEAAPEAVPEAAPIVEVDASAPEVVARSPAQWNKAVKPKKPSTPTTHNPQVLQAVPVPETQTTSSSTSSAPSSTGTQASTGSGAFKPFCDGASYKRATAADIAYAGNVGAPGKWGCNIMLIDCAAIDKYDYSATFDSTGGSFSCSAFNKIGPDGGINGFWYSALDFSVSGGETKCLAFDKNSQGGVACGPGSTVPRTPIGQLSGTWFEFDAGSDRNADNSGSDVSVLVAGAANLPYIGMAIRDPTDRLCSWVKSDGRNEAAYMPGMEDLDGVGCTGYFKGTVKVTLGD